MKVVDNQILRKYDKFGSGAFGADRGDHQHEGVDIIVKKYDKIFSPFLGTISKFGYPYSGNFKFRYIEITGEEYVARIMYSDLDPAFKEGSFVPKNQFIGVAQDISEKYNGITPHIHFELRNLKGKLLDPTKFLKKKV